MESVRLFLLQTAQSSGNRAAYSLPNSLQSEIFLLGGTYLLVRKTM